MKDRTNTLPRAPHPVDNVHGVSARTDNRIGRRAPGRPARTVIPMPGRLLADYYDWDQHLPYSVPLSEVAPGTVVTASGTITAVVGLPGGRAIVVLSSGDHHSAHVLLNASLTRMVAPALYCGYRMNVRGLASQTAAGQPTGIQGLSVQVEVA